MSIEYPEGFTITTLRPSHARPRRLSLGKAQKPRTKRAKRQYIPGNTPHLRLNDYSPRRTL